MSLLSIALRVAFPEFEDIMGQWTWSRSCDVGKHQQEFLCAYCHTCEAGKSCVVADIYERLTPEGRQQLDNLEPGKDASPGVAAWSYGKMQEYGLICCSRMCWPIKTISAVCHT